MMNSYNCVLDLILIRVRFYQNSTLSAPVTLGNFIIQSEVAISELESSTKKF
jgi:hypothetical protein